MSISKRKEKSSQEITKSTFVRRLVLRNPNIALGEVGKLWNKAGMSSKDKPNQHDIYQAKSVIRKRYGINDFDQLPRKKSGEVNITGLMRLLRIKNPSISNKECEEILQLDGFSFSKALWSVMLNAEKKKSSIRSKSKKTARVSSRAKRKASVETQRSDSRLIDVESKLDDLIDFAKSLNEGEVIRLLKEARRHASKSILTTN